MGINEVIQEKRAEEFGVPYGGGAFDEQQPSMGSRDARGALQTPQRTVPRIGSETKLLWLSYAMTGLLAVNAALLIMLLVRI